MTDQFQFDFAPNRVRHNDRPTSIAGAASIAYRAGSQKARLLDAYGAYPAGLTDEEAARIAAIPMTSCWWKRCNELREVGAIVDTGQTRSTGLSGLPRMVCAIVQVSV